MSIMNAQELFPHKINLPSKGKIPNYPTSLDVALFTTDDEKILATTTENNFMDTLCKILNSKINPTNNVNVENLTIQDFDYFTMIIRTEAVGKIYNYQVKCPKCEYITHVALDLLEYMAKNGSEINIAYKEPTIVEIDKKQLRLKLPRVIDYMKIIGEPDELVPQILNQGAIFVNNDEDAEKIFNELTPKLESYIAKFMKYYEYGPNFQIKTKCKKNECGKEIDYLLPFREPSFFMYELVSTKDFENAIRIGLPQ